jgi:TonB family protein
MIFPMILVAALPWSAAPADQPPPGRADARGSVAGLFRPEDYPAGAAARGAQGTVEARLTIGPDGLVQSCTVTGSAGDAELDAATCTVLQARARYTPARDSRGQPVSDTATVRIGWVLTGGDPPGRRPFSAIRFVTSVTRSADGTQSCWFELNGERREGRSSVECAGFAPLGAPPPGEAEYRTITTFVPAGERDAAGAPGVGREVGAAEAEVTIAPDGTFGGCGIVRQTGRLTRIDYCDHLRSTWSQFEDSPNGGTRRGRAQMMLYERRGTRR